MGQETGIAWCHSTFNAWTRCTRLSEACDFCYAEQWANRAKHPTTPDGRSLPVWGPDAPRTPTSKTNWNQPLKWNREAMAMGERRRVFCGSLMDVFENHPALDASGVRARLWDLIEATPMLDWLLLSKRWGTEDIEGMVPRAWAGGWPANVWAGSTVENQPRAEQRLPHLLRVPAVVRYLSVEPMLGPVDLSPWLTTIGAPGDAMLPERALHWVIIGGESGHHARPFDLHYARDLSAQCVEAGVPVFWKQLGAVPVVHFDPNRKSGVEGCRVRGGTPDGGLMLALKDGHGGDVSEWPADLQAPELRRWPR